MHASGCIYTRRNMMGSGARKWVAGWLGLFSIMLVHQNEAELFFGIVIL